MWDGGFINISYMINLETWSLILSFLGKFTYAQAFMVLNVLIESNRIAKIGWIEESRH
jgi:hypothetical protein